MEFLFLMAAVAAAGFAVASLGAYYLWGGKYQQYGRWFVGFGVIAVCFGSMLMTLPIGDGAGRLIAHRQPVTLAAMEGLFETPEGAPIALVGQPETNGLALDNPPRVSASNGQFTFVGFMGVYLALSIWFVFLVRRGLRRVPEVSAGEG